ncbi:MAG: GNAT family N-acetyltransferase [Gammaproteobacteria bacterium]|nr:GNAT family N-acetyltransferase [Gammaproteobacteria bacterium]
MSFHLKQPASEEEFEHYFNLRWQVLRAPWKQPKGSEMDDMETNCFHIMAVDKKNKVVGVARLQNNTAAESQIRYMAVNETMKCQGIGSALMHTMEQHARTSSAKKIILHAREPAVGFYEKLGYRIKDKSYLLFDEIQHYRMEKTL